MYKEAYLVKAIGDAAALIPLWMMRKILHSRWHKPG
jgi:hypothetical protein